MSCEPKKVYQFDKELNFIKEFKSVNQASKQMNIPRRNIRYVCEKLRDSSGGYIWSYERELILRVTKRQDKRVYQFNKRDYLIGEYESVSKASTQTNIPASNISKAALGKRKTTGGYIWSYEEPITIIEDEKHPVKKRRIPNPSILIEKRRKIN